MHNVISHWNVAKQEFNYEVNQVQLQIAPQFYFRYRAGLRQAMAFSNLFTALTCSFSIRAEFLFLDLAGRTGLLSDF